MTAATPRPPPENESVGASAEAPQGETDACAAEAADLLSDIDDEILNPAQILLRREIPNALATTTTPLERLHELEKGARDLAIHVRHGGIDFYEAEQALLDLATGRGLQTDVGQTTVEVAIFRGLRGATNGHDEAPPPDGLDDYFADADAAIERPSPLPTRLMQSSAQFVAGFVPPDYLVDGIVQRRFIYSVTGHTGSGKTAVELRMAAHVALGLPLGKHPVQTGLVAYFAGENPDDVRMRWLALSAEMAFSVETIGVHFIPGAFRISDLAERIRSETKAVGEFSLVVIDTSAAYFEGKDENANVEAAVHARRLRSLINLVSGGPTILVCCHPPKNASDGNLQPRGGGSFIAEMDGNLTCKKDGAIVELHWQGKFRGPDFAPVMFQLRTVTHGILKDSKGRHIPTVVAFPLSDEGQQELAAVERSNEDKLLIAITGDPRASIAELAKLLGWLTRTGEPHKSMTWRLLQRLKQQRLVEEDRGDHIVTDKGKAAIARGGKIQNTANQGEAE